MARLRNAITAFRIVGPWKFCKRVWQQLNEDDLLTLASAMAYSWLFAIFPFLIVLMSVVARLPRSFRSSSRDFINEFVRYALPKSAGKLVMSNIDVVINQPTYKGLLSLSIAIALISASSGFGATMSALDRCYDIPPEKQQSFWRRRLIALIMTAISSALILAVAILVPLGGVLIHMMVVHHVITQGEAHALAILRYVVALALLILIVDMIYAFGPSYRLRFRIFTPGTMFSILIWVLMGFGFAVYLAHFNSYNREYGALAGVAILMLLFYIDSVVLLVGAEIDSEIDIVLGKK